MAFLRGSSIYCIKKSEIDVSQRVTFSSVCITTATISSFGAIVQLVNWSKRMRGTESRRVPSSTPHIVFSLALADLFTCVGAIAMSILFLKLEPAEKHKSDEHVKPHFQNYVTFGMPIESFTMFSYICSYLWTLFYSVDICLQVHKLPTCLNSKVYHLMTWPLAALLVACVQYTVFTSDPLYCSTGIVALLHYSVCYIPLFLVMVCLPFIYMKAYRKVTQNIKRTAHFTDTERIIQKSVRKKFCLIVFVFVLCWLPNFIDGIHDISDYIRNENSIEHDASHFKLWMVEASINPLQGFLNCLVYGQHRQFTTCCRHILSLGRSDSTSSPNSDPQNQRKWMVNSFSGSVKIPVSEISPLLSGRKNTPTVPTPPQNSPREPFSARLLGEFSRH